MKLSAHKLIGVEQVEYLKRDHIRLVDTETQEVYKILGNFNRLVFIGLFTDKITYSAKNTPLQEAVQAWVNINPGKRLIFLHDEDIVQELDGREDRLSLQQEVSGGSNCSDVDTQTQRRNILRRSFNWIQSKLFNKGNT